MQIQEPWLAGVVLALGFALPTSAQPGALPTADDLAVGTFVQVEGKLVAGVLHALQIEVYAEPLDEETLDAAVEAVDLDELTLTVAGRTVSIESETKVRDDDKLPLELFDVKVGQRAKSKGTRDADGTLIARRVRISEFKPDHEDEVKIKGLIEESDPAAGTLSVFGMNVKYTAQTEYQVGT
jgi:hypothetical protein